MGGEQQTSRRSFLKAAGASALLLPLSRLPTGYQELFKPPEPLSQQGYPNTPYCLLTRNYVTLQPGEHMIIHDYLDGVSDASFTAVLVYLLTAIRKVDEGFEGDFTPEEFKLRNIQYIKLPDKNTLLTGLTPKGVEKSYRIVWEGANATSITLSFGPDECFPSPKKTNATTRMPYPVDPERNQNTRVTLSFPNDRIQEGR